MDLRLINKSGQTAFGAGIRLENDQIVRFFGSAQHICRSTTAAHKFFMFMGVHIVIIIFLDNLTQLDTSKNLALWPGISAGERIDKRLLLSIGIVGADL